MRLPFTTAIRTLAGVAITLAAPAALAIPVTYQFTTGTAITIPPGAPPPVIPPELAPLTGFSVSGTFVYDSDAPQTDSVTAPLNLGAAIHAGAFTNLSGSINGLHFADASGQATVGNDTFFFPLPPPGVRLDFLELVANTTLGSPDFTGFALGNLRLANVRLFWIETQAVPELIPDFLTASLLPGVLPDFHGRLALDFVRIDTGALASVQFRDQLRVTRLPEPSTFALAVAGLIVLLGARRRCSKG